MILISQCMVTNHAAPRKMHMSKCASNYPLGLYIYTGCFYMYYTTPYGEDLRGIGEIVSYASTQPGKVLHHQVQTHKSNMNGVSVIIIYSKLATIIKTVTTCVNFKSTPNARNGELLSFPTNLLLGCINHQREKNHRTQCCDI